MNCRGWNPHLALYLEGDLEQDLARQLERHLQSCEECQAFADALRESQSEFRKLAHETIEMSSLNRVRANVLRQVRTIEEERTWIGRIGIWLWGGMRWRYAVLGSIVLALMSVAAWRLSIRTRPTSQMASTSVTSQAGTVEKTVRPSLAESRTVGHRPGFRNKPDSIAAIAPRLDSTISETTATLFFPEVPPAADSSGMESNDTVVQILTDDPNVVIYWLLDQNGGS